MATSAGQVTVELSLDTRKFNRQLRRLKRQTLVPVWAVYASSSMAGFIVGMVSVLIAQR